MTLVRSYPVDPAQAHTGKKDCPACQRALAQAVTAAREEGLSSLTERRFSKRTSKVRR